MIDFKKQISVSKQCKVLNLEKNFLYYARKAESEENLKIMLLMDKQYFNTPFYGYRKMTVWFKNQGFKINEKRTKRLMNLMNWRTIYKEPKTTICNPEHKKYPYLIRNLVITNKNQVWATDITYIAMKHGFMYLIAIIDLHTRYVLNLDVSNTMNADWCANLLKETIEKHGCPEIFNTDQGTQYTSDVHIKVLLDNKIKI